MAEREKYLEYPGSRVPTLPAWKAVGVVALRAVASRARRPLCAGESRYSRQPHLRHLKLVMALVSSGGGTWY